MKKIYIGILALVYMAVSSGIALELHYCMGDKAGMEFFGSSSDTCGRCGMTEKDTGCCHDEYKFYKISDSHKTVSNDIELSASSFAVVSEHFFYNWQMPDNTALTAVNNYTPPDYTAPSSCIMNCVFRI
ncbi:MAG: hypothetical protein IPO42_12270 [Chitinophagaceae bacterium]|nr:hypothetical protein [Chitinophagaceae bacterium]MBK9532531.1 hypothetical protein [Chitinophagaceae bacterium]